MSEADLCQCPKCGRLHNHLRAGTPPVAIAGPSLLRPAERLPPSGIYEGLSGGIRAIMDALASPEKAGPTPPAASDLRERAKATQADVNLMHRVNHGRPVIDGPEGVFIRWDAVMEALAAVRDDAESAGWNAGVEAMRELAGSL